MNDVTYAELLDRYREELAKSQEQVMISAILIEKLERELASLRAATPLPDSSGD